MIAEKAIGFISNPGFEDFDWNSVNMGNVVVNWFGFLAKGASTKTLVSNKSFNRPFKGF